MTSALLLTALLTAAAPEHLKDCPGPSGIAATGVPPRIATPSGSDLFLRLYAVGAQIYTCAPATDGAYLWTLKGPDARLYDASCNQVGTHFTGPTWKLDADGSQVAGKKLADSPGTGGVPWLLLSTTSTGKPGTLATTRFIQRVATSGGDRPAEPCDATNVAKEKASPYTATYLFYRGPR
jgi:hypothetical protein